ncbi:hypothetical protein NDU88_004016 [Pleurodeles waltl]|uniref:Uncharacterized protein n=1 Tax=Pleurodeles waltl TaxID=8319 RepID=A0AAV7W591_PLEWA|nr:hypothetical protein NDU88_004016 [Pleurodeles waltl]
MNPENLPRAAHLKTMCRCGGRLFKQALFSVCMPEQTSRLFRILKIEKGPQSLMSAAILEYSNSVVLL